MSLIHPSNVALLNSGMILQKSERVISTFRIRFIP